MAIHGYTWVYMAIHGITLVYIAIHGYTWLFWYISWYTLITLLKVPTPRWLPNFVLYKFIAIKVIFSRIFPLWDQKGNLVWLMMLSIQLMRLFLNEWVKSSLPGIVTSIMQSHVTKIVDDYISSTEFQRSLADSINFDAAGLETQLGSSAKKVKRTNKFKSSKDSQTGWRVNQTWE